MRCTTCGTQLPGGEAHCSGCGNVTPHYYALSQATSDAPTVVSLAEGRALPLQSANHDSTTYQNPYEPPNIMLPPPPPLQQRRGKRLGVMIGGVLLILLLMGGGVFAWRVYLAPGKPVVPQHFTVQGTSTKIDSNTASTRQDGNNQISHITEHWLIYGGITGQMTNDEIVTTHPDKTVAFTGTSTCACTVSGKSGTLTWSFTGIQAADGSWQGQFFDVRGASDLSRLHGQGTFHGLGVHNTYSSELYFDS